MRQTGCIHSNCDSIWAVSCASIFWVMVVIKCPGCKQTFSSHTGLSMHKWYCKHKIMAFSKILEQWDAAWQLPEGETSQKHHKFEEDGKPGIEEEPQEEFVAQEYVEVQITLVSYLSIVLKWAWDWSILLSSPVGLSEIPLLLHLSDHLDVHSAQSMS